MKKDAITKAKSELEKRIKNREPNTKRLITKKILEARKKKLIERAKTRDYKELEKKYRKQDKESKNYVKIGIKGLDDLFKKGVPKGNSVLIAGGTGTGKTILCLQILYFAAKQGEKCIYLSFEEREDRLRQHMKDFGWDPAELEKKGLLIIKRVDPFDVSRSIEAMLAQAKGELMIEVSGFSDFIPKGFKPDRIVIDSLTALTAAFIQKEDSYRSYIEQSFRYLEKTGATSFLISESEDVPHKLSPTGVEEFLSDGVIALYNIRKGDVRERALEIIKMRGAEFLERIVALKINEKGIEIYPEQEVFGALGK